MAPGESEFGSPALRHHLNVGLLTWSPWVTREPVDRIQGIVNLDGKKYVFWFVFYLNKPLIEF